jgi:hypothetical protein
MKIKSSEIVAECKVCPYCMSEASSEQRMCCGEVHLEAGIITENEIYLLSDIEILIDN